MADTWHIGNRLETPKGPGEGGDREGAAEEEAEGRGGKQGDEDADPSPQKDGSNSGNPCGHRERGRNGG